MFRKHQYVLLCFIFLLSCSPQNNSWNMCRPQSSYPRFHSFGMSKKPVNIYREMGVEFIQTSSGLRTYLNSLFMEFPSSAFDSNKTDITIRTEIVEQQFLADRLAGNQRILLSKEAQAFILNHIAQNRCVTISAGRFEACIRPDELLSNCINSYTLDCGSFDAAQCI